MSDKQSEAANKKARELGGAAVDVGTVPSTSADPDAQKKEVPDVRLPCDGYGIQRFAAEVGMILKTNGVFRRENVPIVINRESGRVEHMTPQRFRTYCAKSMRTSRFEWNKKTGALETSWR